MQLALAKTKLTLIGILTMPMALGGCLMNDPIESELATGGDDPTNSAPNISGTPPQIIKVGVSYSFMPTAWDADNDNLSFRISNQPNWTSFNSNNGQLTGVPFLGSEGTYNDIMIEVSDGEMKAALPMFSITVEPATAPNMPPEISGTPPASVVVGNTYSFTPTATDPDGDGLTFSINNQPGWLAFDPFTGALVGTPQMANAGTYNNISITVFDGQLGSSTPAFSITVSPANRAPTISGTPPSDVIVGQNWSFTPTASDPDGDTLTFSIENQPSWASFNINSGTLSGMPTAANAGTFTNIVITVDDGQLDASLAPFTINVNQAALGSVTLSWTPPTQNTDGTPLTDLSGYRIYHGTSPGSYPNRSTLIPAGVTTHVVENLVPGTYYFVSTAVNAAGIESSYSNVAQKLVN